jgi:DNA-binding XRE family transcriptional regulator
MKASEVKSARLKLKKTQPELAAMLGVTKRTIIRYEQTGAPEATSLAISHLLGQQRKRKKK